MKVIEAAISLENKNESLRANRRNCAERKAVGLPTKRGRKITNFSPAAVKRRAAAKRAKLSRDEFQNVIQLISEDAANAEESLIKFASTVSGAEQWPLLGAALRDGGDAQRVQAAVAQVVRQQGRSPTGKKKRSAHRDPFIAMLDAAHDGSLSPKFLAGCGLSRGYLRTARSRMKKKHEWPAFLLDEVSSVSRGPVMLVEVISSRYLY